jgi:hypothetical protein
MSDIERIKLIVTLSMARIDILKLKADDYNWQCHTPQNVKEQLENSLLEIDELLAELAHKQRQAIELPPNPQP